MRMMGQYQSVQVLFKCMKGKAHSSQRSSTGSMSSGHSWQCSAGYRSRSGTVLIKPCVPPGVHIPQRPHPCAYYGRLEVNSSCSKGVFSLMPAQLGLPNPCFPAAGRYTRSTRRHSALPRWHDAGCQRGRRRCRTWPLGVENRAVSAQIQTVSLTRPQFSPIQWL